MLWLLLALIGAAPPLAAGDRVGAYGIVERVALDPPDRTPERIRIWGVFVFADPHNLDGYGPVRRGYLFYACPPGRETACLNDWADLRFVSGTGKAIGFGLRTQPMGALRQDGDPAARPDPYLFEGGLVKVESKDPAFVDLVARLKDALGK